MGHIYFFDIKNKRLQKHTIILTYSFNKLGDDGSPYIARITLCLIIICGCRWLLGPLNF